MFKVEAPKMLLPARGGLLPAINVIRDAADVAAYHGVSYEALPAGISREIPEPGTDKVFDKYILQRGVLFGVYRGLESPTLMGLPDTADAKELFGAGETVAVEKAVQRLLLNPKAVDITPTPGTPVKNLKQALGLLQQYAADNYTGLPLLHGNRFVSELLPELVADPQTWVQHTRQGTPLANGGGYGAAGPGARTASAGTGWLYISGQLNLWQGELNLIETTNQYENRNYVLAEATYAATADGPVAAILVGI